MPNAVGWSRCTARPWRGLVAVSSNGGRGSVSCECLTASRCHGDAQREEKGARGGARWRGDVWLVGVRGAHVGRHARHGHAASVARGCRGRVLARALWSTIRPLVHTCMLRGPRGCSLARLLGLGWRERERGMSMVSMAGMARVWPCLALL